MTYSRATWLAQVLRAAGLTVIEHPGWKTRGLAGGSFTPRAVVWHHDASPKGDSPGVPAYLIRNFSRASAQVWIDRRGRWHLIAAGRAPHAGAVRRGMPGNAQSIGIETDHTTGEAWPPALVNSLRRGTAAILKHLRRGSNDLHFHKSVCDPPGRKDDPDGLDLATERRRVAAIMVPPRRRPAARPKVSLRAIQRAVAYDASRRISSYPAGTRIVERALSAEGLLPSRFVDGHFSAAGRDAYAAFQRRLGYRGTAANGIPGRASLVALGKRRGFEVAP